MEKYNDVLERLAKTSDPLMRRQLLDRLPEDIRQQGDLRKIEAWWKVRYHYVDKKQTRVGDRFVGLYLSACNSPADKKSVARLREMYKDTFLTDEMKAVKEEDPEGFKEQLRDAASIYVDSLKNPRPLFGLFTPKDKSENLQQRRVGSLVLREHMDPLWRFLGDMEDSKTVATSFCYATEIMFPGITYVLGDIIEESEVEGDFKLWINDVFNNVKLEEKKNEEKD